jgi:hypothetical protein
MRSLAYSVSREPFANSLQQSLAFATGECIGLAIGLPMHSPVANGECKEEKKKVL